MVAGVGNIEIARGVGSYRLRQAQVRIYCQAGIAAFLCRVEARPTIAREPVDIPLRIDVSDPMILGVGDVYISGCVNGDAFGEVQLCRGGESIVAA